MIHYATVMLNMVNSLRILDIRGGDTKFPGIVKKNLFKVFVLVGNFNPLRSTPPVTGCSNPSAAPTTGNNV